MTEKSNGSTFEGLMTEIGGQIQQDTSGNVEYLRNKTTNEPDGGVDGELVVKQGFDIFKYIKSLKSPNKNHDNNQDEL